MREKKTKEDSEKETKKILFPIAFTLIASTTFDILSTLQGGTYKFLEANPIFLLTGKISLHLLIKIAIIVYCYSLLIGAHKFKTENGYYTFLLLCFLLIAAQTAAGINNQLIDKNLRTYAQTHNTTSLEVAKAYAEQVPIEKRIRPYLPLFITFIITIFLQQLAFLSYLKTRKNKIQQPGR